MFTLETWREAAKRDHRVAGFRESIRSRARKVGRRDLFLGYIAGEKRWGGVFEVESGPYTDDTRIWADDLFPVRFNVRPLVILSPQQGVPNSVLADKLEMMKTSQWSRIRRGGLPEIDEKDALVILSALKKLRENWHLWATHWKEYTGSTLGTAPRLQQPEGG